jgi:hypothetical protein
MMATKPDNGMQVELGVEVRHDTGRYLIRTGIDLSRTPLLETKDMLRPLHPDSLCYEMMGTHAQMRRSTMAGTVLGSGHVHSTSTDAEIRLICNGGWADRLVGVADESMKK